MLNKIYAKHPLVDHIQLMPTCDSKKNYMSGESYSRFSRRNLICGESKMKNLSNQKVSLSAHFLLLLNCISLIPCNDFPQSKFIIKYHQSRFILQECIPKNNLAFTIKNSSNIYIVQNHILKITCHTI